MDEDQLQSLGRVTRFLKQLRERFVKEPSRADLRGLAVAVHDRAREPSVEVWGDLLPGLRESLRKLAESSPTLFDEEEASKLISTTQCPYPDDEPDNVKCERALAVRQIINSQAAAALQALEFIGSRSIAEARECAERSLMERLFKQPILGRLLYSIDVEERRRNQDLAEQFGKSTSHMSHLIKPLKEFELIAVYRDGRGRYFQLTPLGKQVLSKFDVRALNEVLQIEHLVPSKSTPTKSVYTQVFNEEYASAHTDKIALQTTSEFKISQGRVEPARETVERMINPMSQPETTCLAAICVAKSSSDSNLTFADAVKSIRPRNTR